MTERMWRVAAIFRVITLVYAAILIIRDHDQYAHPAGGLAALAVIICWSAVVLAAYARPGGRAHWLIAADVAVAAALVLLTRWVDSPATIAAGMPTLPSFWAASPVLACAITGGPWVGLAGALVISAADLIERPELSLENPFSNILLLLIAGGIGGYIVRLGVQAETATARVARTEAALAERDRIARGIHDSVLQVLALVSRRGSALGGEAAELGRLAAEQESALRRLVTSDALNVIGPTDVRALIEQFGDPRVIVSCPAGPVLLSAGAAGALAEATRAALDNVRRHAGPGTTAWVLVEETATAARVSVRDDGPGFAQGRLTQAAAAGRLGVSHSIVGRMRAAGGTAIVTSVPGQGTEVELAIPRD
jgi:signal transduction histidine kinase